MVLFLASAIPAVVVALIGWGVALWARSAAAKVVSEPIKERYGDWAK